MSIKQTIGIGCVNAYFLEIETLNLSRFLASFEPVVQNGI